MTARGKKKQVFFMPRHRKNQAVGKSVYFKIGEGSDERRVCGIVLERLDGDKYELEHSGGERMTVDLKWLKEHARGASVQKPPEEKKVAKKRGRPKTKAPEGAGPQTKKRKISDDTKDTKKVIRKLANAIGKALKECQEALNSLE